MALSFDVRKESPQTGLLNGNGSTDLKRDHSDSNLGVKNTSFVSNSSPPLSANKRVKEQFLHMIFLYLCCVPFRGNYFRGRVLFLEKLLTALYTGSSCLHFSQYPWLFIYFGLQPSLYSVSINKSKPKQQG